MPPKRTLEWKKQAQADLFAIVDFISDDNPEAAQTLKNEIEEKTEKLREFPDLYKLGRKRGTREMVAHKNYIVIYRVTNNQIEVLRVKHSAQQWP